MNDEPFFLLNEFLDNEREELSKIIDISSRKNLKDYEKAIFIRNFTNQLFRAYKKEKKPLVEKKKKELESKKLQLLEKLKQLQEKKRKPQIKPKEENTIQKVSQVGQKTSQTEEKELLKLSFDGHIYTVSEPILSEDEKSILIKLKELNINLEKKDELLSHINIISKKLDIKIKPEYQKNIKYYIIRDNKFGKLTSLIEDPNVKEIICNNSNKPVLVQYKDLTDIPTNIDFESDERINDFIKKIAKKTDQKLSSENPFLNAVLGKLKIQASLGSEFIKPKFVIVKD